MADALKMLRDEGPLTPLAGCTDLYVSLNFGTLKETRFLDLWGLDALRGIDAVANDFEMRSNSGVLPCVWNKARRARSRSNRISRSA